jgi:hypothetical protein
MNVGDGKGKVLTDALDALPSPPVAVLVRDGAVLLALNVALGADEPLPGHQPTAC